MNRWLTRAVLGAALLTTPLVVMAGAGHAPDPAQMAAKLSQGLGLDIDTADEVAAIAAAAQEEGQTLKSAAKVQAEALKAALDAGDTGAMESAMGELQRIQGDAQALQEATQDDIKALLTTEQRAKWTLFHLHQRVKKEKMLHHMDALRDLQGEGAGAGERVPHFRSE